MRTDYRTGGFVMAMVRKEINVRYARRNDVPGAWECSAYIEFARHVWKS